MQTQISAESYGIYEGNSTFQARLPTRERRFDPPIRAQYTWIAGWSSPVARWAHNPKVAGSNPAPATKFEIAVSDLEGAYQGV